VNGEGRKGEVENFSLRKSDKRGIFTSCHSNAMKNIGEAEQVKYLLVTPIPFVTLMVDNEMKRLSRITFPLEKACTERSPNVGDNRGD